jgi:hypothetical protein
MDMHDVAASEGLVETLCGIASVSLAKIASPATQALFRTMP